MSELHETAKLTSKGQITLPKPIRQVLGVTTGDQVVFDVHQGQVVVSRNQSQHADPAIGAFLDLLEADIRSGRHIQTLPGELAEAMLANAGRGVDPTEPIDGDVAL